MIYKTQIPITTENLLAAVPNSCGVVNCHLWRCFVHISYTTDCGISTQSSVSLSQKIGWWITPCPTVILCTLGTCPSGAGIKSLSGMTDDGYVVRVNFSDGSSVRHRIRYLLYWNQRLVVRSRWQLYQNNDVEIMSKVSVKSATGLGQFMENKLLNALGTCDTPNPHIPLGQW